ncbi:MAG: HAMP domain-containing sensor histidine kinase [Leeuwenhoekiella sp.]
MRFNPNQQFSRWFIILSAIIITALILWNTSLFFDQLKQAERDRMEIWAKSVEAVNEIPLDANLNATNTLIQIIGQKNTSIPVIITDENDNILNSINIPQRKLEDSIETKNLLREMGNENPPIRIDITGVDLQYAYYSHSPIINQLKWFPLAVIIIVFLFIALIYFFYATSKASEQNLLWAGMAKETAHQIGTPLSSLVGWTEILKTENVNPEYIDEINNDISRLEVITGRFSKIGSVPILETANIAQETEKTINYLRSRSSKLIDFQLNLPPGNLFVNLNPSLFSWTIENLVKNAIDAMKGKGKLTITLTRDARYAKIQISDTGKGIPKNNFASVFNPGFTTKKRGWGLGLSLAKRIIEEYHDGQIKVLKSEVNKGTTFQISLKLLEQ